MQDGTSASAPITPENFNLEGKELRPLTFGEKAVGLTFNPGGDPLVTKVKKLYAEIIDLCNDEREKVGRGEKARHFSTAITEAESAQMRAVKAITWRD